MKRFGRIELKGTGAWGQIEGNEFLPIDRCPWEKDHRQTGKPIRLDSKSLLAPVSASKVVLVGLNYAEHVKESQSANAVPDEPVLFMKPTTAIIGPNDRIVYPRGVDRVDYEGELAVIIGQKISRANADEVRDKIFGYTCLNDVTARNLQKKDVQWTRAKGFDTFCPVGPWITTGIDPLDLKLETYLNDEKKQSGRTSQQIWNVFQLTSFISQVMTLLPGDLISTGTPAGVGPIKPGDVIRIEIENIAILENSVAAR